MPKASEETKQTSGGPMRTLTTFDHNCILSITNDGYVPSEVNDKVRFLFEELVATFSRTMERRGIHIKTIDIAWNPTEHMEDTWEKISKVTRLRAVIETDH
jgi:hypothetical protein